MKINKAIIAALLVIAFLILCNICTCMLEEEEPPEIIANPYNTVSEY